MMKFRRGRTYIDRKGFEYVCVGLCNLGAFFLAHKADGTTCAAARFNDGRYIQGQDHDYDIVRVK